MQHPQKSCQWLQQLLLSYQRVPQSQTGQCRPQQITLPLLLLLLVVTAVVPALLHVLSLLLLLGLLLLLLVMVGPSQLQSKQQAPQASICAQAGSLQLPAVVVQHPSVLPTIQR
jgi:hypothetical protein